MQLHRAARKGKIEAIQAWLHAGQPVDPRDRSGYTPLMRAAEFGQAEACQVLLAAGADPLATDHNGIDALYIACCGGYLDIVRDLLTHGASLVPRVTSEVHLGYTPLMGAVLSGNLDLVRYLVEAGADVTAVARTGHTALKWAKEFRHKHIYVYLKHQGARPKTLVPATNGAPALPRDPANPMQQLRAEVRNFPHAAAQPAFVDLVHWLGQVTGKPPVASAKRAGLYNFTLGRKRLAALANHYKLDRPSYDLDELEEDAQRIALILEHIQRDVQGHGALLIVDALWNVGEPIKAQLYPTTNPYAVLAACGTNGINYGHSTRKVIAWLRALERTHPFLLTSCGYDHLAGDFLEPVPDARRLARKMYRFCPDIVEQGTQTVRALARTLEQGQSFYFWWD